MISRRDFLTVSAATALVTGYGANIGRVAAAQNITQDDLLKFNSNISFKPIIGIQR